MWKKYFYENKEIPNEIVLSEEIDKEMLSELLDTKIITPQRGRKKEFY